MTSWYSVHIFLMLVSMVSPMHLGWTTSSAIPVIHNGTSVEIGDMERTFVFCSAQVEDLATLHEYQVAWRGSDGGFISRNPESLVFSLGRGIHIPHSYLVFSPFVPESVGVYSCVLFFRGQEQAFSTIDVRPERTRSRRTKNTNQTI